MGWIENTLSKAEKNGESIFILCHFPQNSKFVVKGNNFGYIEFGVRFSSLKERYANIIKGVFYGHNHEDFLEISNSFVDGKPTMMAFGNPALTT